MKRTLDNCTLVQKHGRPEQRNGKCLGYANDTDEPCDTCKKCKYNEWLEDKDMEEIQSLKDFAKALIAQKKIDTGELKLERMGKMKYQFESNKIECCAQCDISQFGDENNPGYCNKLDRLLSYLEFYESKPKHCPLKEVEKKIDEKKLIKWLEERLQNAREAEDISEVWAYGNILDAIENKEFEEETK